MEITANYLAVSAISASLLAACVFGVWLSVSGHHAYITGGFLLTIIGAVLGGVFLQYFKADFVELMKIEGDSAGRAAGAPASAEQRAAAAKAWFQVLGYTISAFASMLVLTIAVAPSLGWQASSGAMAWRAPTIGIALATLLVIPALGGVRQAARPHPEDESVEEKLSGSSTPALWSAVSAYVASAFGLYALIEAGSVNWLALGQSALLAAFVAESVLGNGAWLHTAKLRPVSRLTVGAAGLAALVVIYWSLTAGIRSGNGTVTLGAALADWISSVLFVFVLAEAATLSVYVAGGCPYRTDYPPANNVAQDTLLVTILWLVLGWVPQVILAHVPASVPERWAAIGTILSGFMLLFGPAFLWVLENNDTHVERQRQRLAVSQDGPLHDLAVARSSTDRIRSLPKRIGRYIRPLSNSTSSELDHVKLDDEQFIVRLSGHTAVQNAAALSLATLTVVGVLGISAGVQPEATGLSALPGTVPK